MNIARILYPVMTLGPGKRIGIWVCGCARGCKGCSNPELWHSSPEYEISVDNVFSLVCRLSKDHPVDGFTISGGEPMNQAAELMQLIGLLRTISEDILVYSGYTLDELRQSGDATIHAMLNSIAVLIDGPYVDEMNDGVAMRGSSNQEIRLLDDRYADAYRDYMMQNHNRIQNFTTTDGIVSVGIHNRGFSG